MNETTIAQPGDSAPVSTPHGMRETDIRTADIAPTQYVAGIPFYPVGGTVFIWGEPGIGKSFVQQGLNHSIAWGKMIAGFQPEAVGDILYADFEGNLAITQERSLLLTPHGQVPGENGGKRPETDTYYLYSEDWKDHTFAEHLAELDDRLAAKEADGVGFSLVILDTYTAFVGEKPGDANAYEHDRKCIEMLNRLAEKYQVCIVLIHHPNKRAEISGSTGRAGTAWVVMSFTKGDKDEQAILRTEKNRVGWAMEYVFEWDRNRIWRLSDEITPKVALAKGNNRAILHRLSRAPLTLAELRACLPDMPEGSLKSALFRLSRKGDVRCVDGRWEPTFPTTQVLPSVPVWQPWPNCPECRTKVNPDLGCQNSECPEFRAENWSPPPPAAAAPAPVDPEPAAPEPPEAVPATSGSDATGYLVKTLSASRLYPVFRLRDEIKDKIPYHEMCLGGRSNQWALFPARPTGQTVKSFDRKASYFSSNPWVAPNLLTRRGPMTWDEVKAEKLAGIFQIISTGWPHKHLPSPYGRDTPRKGSKTLVTRPTLNRLQQVAAAGLIEFPVILSGYVGKGSEELFKPWFDWCLAQRRTALDPEQAAARKADQNTAVGSMRIVTPGKAPGVIDRPDWQYAIIAHHYAQMDRYAYTALTAGEPLVAVGNTDELVFAVPDDEDPQLWVPASMKEHLTKHRFDVKYVQPDSYLFESPKERKAHG